MVIEHTSDFAWQISHQLNCIWCFEHQDHQALVAHQGQLSSFLEQLDHFQKLQRQLVASKAEDAHFVSSTLSGRRWFAVMCSTSTASKSHALWEWTAGLNLNLTVNGLLYQWDGRMLLVYSDRQLLLHRWPCRQLKMAFRFHRDIYQYICSTEKRIKMGSFENWNIFNHMFFTNLCWLFVHKKVVLWIIRDSTRTALRHFFWAGGGLAARVASGALAKFRVLSWQLGSFFLHSNFQNWSDDDFVWKPACELNIWPSLVSKESVAEVNFKPFVFVLIISLLQALIRMGTCKSATRNPGYRGNHLETW